MTFRAFAYACLAALPAAGMSPAGAALIHDYEFATNLNDAVPGGAALSLSSDAGGTGSVTAGFYNFTAGGGLALMTQLPGAVYTIDMSVSLATVSGYRKLVSFENISADIGLYNLNGSLDLYNVAASTTSTDFAPGVFTDVRISRDSTGLVTGYINGVQKLSYNDTSNAFTAASALYFLRDDTDQNAEQSAGSADFIRIYDTATPTGTLPVSAVPEPASWAMFISGFGLLGAALRRRRTVVDFA